MDEIAPGLKTFDAFPKVSSTYSIRSSRGGTVTILLAVSCLFLAWIQLAEYIGGVEEQQFSVDKVVSTNMQINMDVTIAMPCGAITVDVLDQSRDRFFAAEMLRFDPVEFDSSNHHLLHSSNLEFDSFHGVLKRARKSRFKRTQRKNDNAQACRIYGSIPVTRVKGDLHITARGYAYFDQRVLPPNELNFSHIVDEFSFGEYFPKLVNPLDGVVSTNDDHMARYQYFLSVVPTTYVSSTTGHVVETNQYAVTEQLDGMNSQVGQPPGIFFKYDMEPIRLTITDTRMPFSQWLVRLINILGGLVVCTGWLYKLSERSLARILGKPEYGRVTMLDTGVATEK